MARVAVFIIMMLVFISPLAAQRYKPPVPPETTKSNELSISIPAPITGMHPYFDRGAASRYAQALALRPLLAFDANWQLVCLLCETMPTNDNGGIRQEMTGGKQGVAMTFTLKQGLRWGDGRSVTSMDAAFNGLIREHLPLSLSSLSRVTVQSPQQFTLHFSDLTIELASLTDFYLLPHDLEEAAVGSDYPQKSRYRRSPLDAGLYNGAYRLLDTIGTTHFFTVNTSFSGVKPQFTYARLTQSASVAASLEAYSLGRVTMLPWDLIAASEDVARFSDRNRGAYAAVVRPSALFEHIALNLDNPLLRDKRTRLALLLSLDRTVMNRAAFYGDAVPMAAFINPLDRAFNGDIAVPPFSLERARQLLTDAGFKAGSDGILVAENGQRFSLNLLTTENNAARGIMQQLIISAWKKIGVEVTPSLVPASELLETILPQRRFDGAALFAIASFPDAAATALLHSRSIPSQVNGFSGQNYSGYKNPTMDTLLDNLDKTTSTAYRNQLRRGMQQIYASDYPSLPLFFRPARFLLPIGASGIQTTAHQSPSTLWVEEWRLPAPQH